MVLFEIHDGNRIIQVVDHLDANLLAVGLPKYGEAYPVHDSEADSEDQADQPNG